MQATQQTIEKRLGQLLLNKGWVDGEHLLRAIQSQRALGGRLGTCLLEMGVVTEEHLLEILSDQLGVPAVRVEQLRYIPERILDLVPAKVALRCEAIPFAVDEHGVDIATLNVQNLAFLDELTFCTNQRVRPHIANEARVFEALERYYGLECPRRYGHLLDRLNRNRYMWSNGHSGASATPLDEVELESIPALGDATASDLEISFEDLLLRPPASRSPAPRALQATPPTPPPPAPVEATSISDDSTWPASMTAPVIDTEERSPLSAAGDALGLAEVDRQLAQAVDHAAVGKIALGYLARHFSRCALFKVRQDFVVGWLAYGESFDAKLFRAVLIPLAEPSVFHNLRQGAEVHLGPLPPMPSHRQLVRCWGGVWPPQCLIMPVRVRGKLVSAFYGDRGPAGLNGFPLDPFNELAEKTAEALELCILRKKLQSN